MRDGIRAAFAETNRGGGINGRTLELISRDDGYDPIHSIEATRRLLEDDDVFGIISSGAYAELYHDFVQGAAAA